jgi:uncharacterized spore protein YtfJ
MKKIILVVLLLIAAFGIWKYISIKSQQPSVIKETKDTLEKTVNYVPDTIERKKVMENNLNDSITKENEKLQNSLNEIK